MVRKNSHTARPASTSITILARKNRLLNLSAGGCIEHQRTAGGHHHEPPCGPREQPCQDLRDGNADHGNAEQAQVDDDRRAQEYGERQDVGGKYGKIEKVGLT